jgi:hypothetical protein
MTGVLDDGPTLLQCFAIAADAHREYQRARLAPQSEPEEPPDNPLLKRALDQLREGDIRGCVDTMQALDKGFDPNQPRDPNGKWTHGAANTAGRIAAATEELERALRDLPDHPDGIDNLAQAIARMQAEINALPADHELTAPSRRALATAQARLQLVRDNLERVFDYFSRRPRPRSGDGRGDGRGNGFGKAAAPLIIWKREDTAMRTDDIDQLEAQCDALLRKVANALGEDLDDDDDEGMADTWSEHADAQANGNNSSLDDAADDDGLDDDEEDDHRVNLGKAERFVQQHQNMAPVPVDDDHPAHPYRTDVQLAGQRPNKHKFESKIEFIQNRDGCSKTEAQSRARMEHPSLYSDYQQHVANETTQQQHTRRAGYGLGKRVPDTFETLVVAEMRKGCTEEIAAQRVVQQHGSAVLRKRMFKRDGSGETLVTRFMAKVDQTMIEEDLYDRSEAMRRVRKRYAHLFGAMQSV